MLEKSRIELAEETLESVCQQVYGESIDKLLRPWGEVNRLPNDGLRAFSSKLIYNCGRKGVEPKIMEALKDADRILHGYGARNIVIIQEFLEIDKI